jgi:hypothetical protein
LGRNRILSKHALLVDACFTGHTHLLEVPRRQLRGARYPRTEVRVQNGRCMNTVLVMQLLLKWLLARRLLVRAALIVVRPCQCGGQRRATAERARRRRREHAQSRRASLPFAAAEAPRRGQRRPPKARCVQRARGCITPGRASRLARQPNADHGNALAARARVPHPLSSHTREPH